MSNLSFDRNMPANSAVKIDSSEATSGSSLAADDRAPPAAGRKQAQESSEDKDRTSKDDKNSNDASKEFSKFDDFMYFLILKLVGLGLEEDSASVAKRVEDCDDGKGEVALFEAYFAICVEEVKRTLARGGRMIQYDQSQLDDRERENITYDIALWVASKYLKEEPESIEQRATEAAKDKADNFKLFNAFFSMCLSEAFQIYDGDFLIEFRKYVDSGEDEPIFPGLSEWMGKRDGSRAS